MMLDNDLRRIKTLNITNFFALFFCILNMYHIFPGFDLFHNLVVGMVLSLGLCVFYFIKSETLFIPKSITTWCLLLILLVIQPIINDIDYIDSYIFPFGSILLISIYSIANFQVLNKEKLLRNFQLSLVILMVVSSLIQLLQLRGLYIHFGNIRLSTLTDRLSANFLQPNQAAFMFVLAQTACLYFYTESKKNVWLILFALFCIDISLTLSRAGLLMSVANVVFYHLVLQQTKTYKFKNCIKILIILLISSSIGVLIFNNLSVQPNFIGSGSAVQRFNEGTLFRRISLQEQAWLIFLDHPITGIGWGNFVKGGMSHFDQLQWFTFSDSHFFLSQILSELGILGLLAIFPLVLFILKKFNLKMSNFEATCYTSLIVILMYASSEFPLWYLRYLFIFTFYITMLSTNFWQVNVKFKPALLLLSLFIFILSSSYALQMIKLNKIFVAINNNGNESEVEQLYKNIPNTFGLTEFREQVLFYFLPINEKNINYKLKLSIRIVPRSLNRASAFKYGELLMVANQKEKAENLFKMSCSVDWEEKGNCEDISLLLKQKSSEDKDYLIVYEDLYEWLKQYNPRKGK